MERLPLFDIAVSTVKDIDDIIGHIEQKQKEDTGAFLVTFVNPHSWFIRSESPAYERILPEFDLVLADGIGVVKATQWVHGQTIGRLSFDGSSLFHPVFDHLNSQCAKLYVVGGVDGVASSAVNRMQALFPEIQYVGVSDGYRSHEDIIRDVLASGADIVLCGMGAPRQEQFLWSLKSHGFRGIGFTCGGFLDQLAESAQYYPAWIDQGNIRWAFRLCKEPRRLWRRYTFQYRPFIQSTLLALVRARRTRLTTS